MLKLQLSIIRPWVSSSYYYYSNINCIPLQVAFCARAHSVTGLWAGLRQTNGVMEETKAVAGENRYENREHERRAVTVSVSERFTDLSTVHRSFGSLSLQVNMSRRAVPDIVGVHD